VTVSLLVSRSDGLHDGDVVISSEIDRVLDQRVWIGCFPFRFKGGEAAFCRFVAFVEK